MSMGPSEGMKVLSIKTMNAMCLHLSDEELENDGCRRPRRSTYPTILTDMFTVFDQNVCIEMNYSSSTVSTLTDCEES